ncbi:MAG TPA: rRNA adenine N-6-methyltransferase family protein, partial [Candidatus Paceibacterota bacterium]
MGRRLGQHFLKGKKALKKIVGALELKTGDVIVEIGPGHGELTREILNKFKDLKIQTSKVVAIEKDPTLVDSIKYLVSSKKLRVIEGDALKVLPVLDTKYKMPNTGYKLVGNIPYYITGHLL